MSAALILHLVKSELEGMAEKYDFVFDSVKVSLVLSQFQVFLSYAHDCVHF
jgi:hypothetical protein